MRILCFIGVYSLCLCNIPSIIWSYWEGPKHNLLNKIPITWVHHSPNYTINYLDFNTIGSWIEVPPFAAKLTSVQRSDLFKIMLLYKYGGVYLDPSIILLRNLSDIIHPNGLTLVYNDDHGKYGSYESAFISTLPKQEWIKNMEICFTEILTNETFYKHLNDKYRIYEKFGEGFYDYFRFYTCLHHTNVRADKQYMASNVGYHFDIGNYNKTIFSSSHCFIKLQRQNRENEKLMKFLEEGIDNGYYRD